MYTVSMHNKFTTSYNINTHQNTSMPNRRNLFMIQLGVWWFCVFDVWCFRDFEYFHGLFARATIDDHRWLSMNMNDPRLALFSTCSWRQRVTDCVTDCPDRNWLRRLMSKKVDSAQVGVVSTGSCQSSPGRSGLCAVPSLVLQVRIRELLELFDAFWCYEQIVMIVMIVIDLV